MLQELQKKYYVAFVGGSDLKKIIEQMGKEGSLAKRNNLLS